MCIRGNAVHNQCDPELSVEFDKRCSCSVHVDLWSLTLGHPSGPLGAHNWWWLRHGVHSQTADAKCKPPFSITSVIGQSAIFFLVFCFTVHHHFLSVWLITKVSLLIFIENVYFYFFRFIWTALLSYYCYFHYFTFQIVHLFFSQYFPVNSLTLCLDANRSVFTLIGLKL